VKLATWALGTLALCLGSLAADDVLWDVPLSILMAVATYFAAPHSVGTWLQRRVTAGSVAAWLGTVGTFDAYHLVATGVWHPEWSLGALAGNSLLYVCAGLVWTFLPRHYYWPAGGASVIGGLSLLAWSWPR
jgi:hypothetical protein